MKIDSLFTEAFESRHIGPDSAQANQMLEKIGASSVDELIEQTVPASIRLKKPLDLPPAQTEYEFLNRFKQIAAKNKVFKTLIGAGYYNTITPPVVLRNILENPGWYTAYTPYQAEIAQGRLEALINYQTMIIDLTGMEIANASLLDEATAAAEAMHLLYASRKASKKNAHKFFVDQNTFPQTIAVLNTRSMPIGVELVVGDILTFDHSNPDFFAVFVQNPDNHGQVRDLTDLIAAAHDKQLHVVVAADLLSLALIKSPGEMGADVVVGS